MGVHLIDKPVGITSFDVIRQLRKQGYPRKMGHAGTLDPLASGLLIICSEGDTKRISDFMGQEKIYQTTIDLSIETDTRDMDPRGCVTSYPYTHTGATIHNTTIQAPTKDDIDSFLSSLHGTHHLPLTPFSAKKLDGKKLYEYAREGSPKFMDVPMTIKGHEILEYNFPLLTLELHVGKGTYIRSICHHVGRHFGLGGVVMALRRTYIGTFCVNDAEPLTIYNQKTLHK